MLRKIQRRYRESGFKGLATSLRYRTVRHLNPHRLYWKYVASRPYRNVSRVLPSGAAVCLTESCNLNCSFCARHSVPQVPDMTLRDYKRLVKKMWWATGVNIIGLGEQLLHRDIAEAIEWTTRRHLTVALSTNGMVDLDDRSLIQPLLKCKQVQFSIDTVNPNDLNRIRVGADFARIDHNLRLLLEAKRKKSNVPIVNINAVLTRETLHGIVRLIEYAHSLPTGLDYLQLNSVTLAEYQHAHKPLIGNKNVEASKHVKDAIEYAKAEGLIFARNDMDFTRLLKQDGPRPILLGLIPDKILTPPTMWRQCRSIYGGPGFRPNGDIYICCYRPDLKLGNGFTDDILSAWNGPVARNFRQQVLTDNPPECCHTCNFAYEGNYPAWTPKMPAE